MNVHVFIETVPSVLSPETVMLTCPRGLQVMQWLALQIPSACRLFPVNLPNLLLSLRLQIPTRMWPSLLFVTARTPSCSLPSRSGTTYPWVFATLLLTMTRLLTSAMVAVTVLLVTLFTLVKVPWVVLALFLCPLLVTL